MDDNHDRIKNQGNSGDRDGVQEVSNDLCEDENDEQPVHVREEQHDANMDEETDVNDHDLQEDTTVDEILETCILIIAKIWAYKIMLIAQGTLEIICRRVVIYKVSK